MINALTGSGLVLQQIKEDDGPDSIPKLLALAATQPSTGHDDAPP